MMVATSLPASSGVERIGVAGERVAHIDAGAGVLLVLDFGIGERGAVVDAPIDRLEAAIDEAGFEEAVEGFEDARFVGARHGAVGIVPAAEDAEADELAGLQLDIFLRVFAAVAEEFGRQAFQAFCGRAFRRL
jgi:hypothetical protein